MNIRYRSELGEDDLNSANELIKKDRFAKNYFLGILEMWRKRLGTGLRSHERWNNEFDNRSEDMIAIVDYRTNSLTFVANNMNG